MAVMASWRHGVEVFPDLLQLMEFHQGSFLQLIPDHDAGKKRHGISLPSKKTKHRHIIDLYNNNRVDPLEPFITGPLAGLSLPREALQDGFALITCR